MYTSISRSFWLQLLLVFLILQLPTCMAQGSTYSGVSSATANTPGPVSSTSISTQPSSTSSAPAQTHTVQVGLADHKFRPDVTEAAVGDTIEFRFYPSNHSVVRAEYGFPCIPYEMTGSNKQGFFSGFNAVDKVLSDPPKYQVKVNDTNPIFFYCSAPGSCLTYAMVGAINPNSSTPISTQQQRARDSAYMLNPGEPFPAESPLPSGLPTSTSTPVPVSNDKKHGLAPGAIAGIVVGGLGVVILAALMFFLWGRNKALSEEVERKESSVTRRVNPGSISTQITRPSPIAHPNTASPPRNANNGFGIYQPRYTSSPTASRDADYKPTSPHMQNHPAYSHMYDHPAHSPPMFELPNAQHAVNSYFPMHTPHQQRTVSPSAPPYAHTQQRNISPAPPYGWYVDSSARPAEVEGTPVRGDTRHAKDGGGASAQGRRVEVRWEEVGGTEGRAE